jgi:hypothetical protein
MYNLNKKKVSSICAHALLSPNQILFGFPRRDRECLTFFFLDKGITFLNYHTIFIISFLLFLMYVINVTSVFLTIIIFSSFDSVNCTPRLQVLFKCYQCTYFIIIDRQHKWWKKTSIAVSNI